MRIAIASKDPLQLAAVESVFKHQKRFTNAEIVQLEPLPEGKYLSKMPEYEKEVKARAEDAFYFCAYSVAFFLGLIKNKRVAPVLYASIYNGTEHSVGRILITRNIHERYPLYQKDAEIKEPCQRLAILAATDLPLEQRLSSEEQLVAQAYFSAVLDMAARKIPPQLPFK